MWEIKQTNNIWGGNESNVHFPFSRNFIVAITTASLRYKWKSQIKIGLRHMKPNYLAKCYPRKADRLSLFHEMNGHVIPLRSPRTLEIWYCKQSPPTTWNSLRFPTWPWWGGNGVETDWWQFFLNIWIRWAESQFSENENLLGHVPLRSI